MLFYIEESGGGAGQGLYSSHLAAVYRCNHAFIDPNLWHNEGELRKQLEQFSSASIITAQEKPESNRFCRGDLYEKMVSTHDLAAARKPYGYVTRTLRIVGCKRIETKDLMSFKNIPEANLNSIFRSRLVRIPQAVFVSGEYLEKEYSDVSKDGIFPKDPTLRAFLESGPAIAASLHHQLEFELTQSREDCRRLIETYAQAAPPQYTYTTAAAAHTRQRAGLKLKQGLAFSAYGYDSGSNRDMYVCIYIYINVCTFLYIYIYTHTHTCTHMHVHISPSRTLRSVLTLYEH